MTDETIARTSNSNRSSNDPSAGSAERVRTERTGAAGDTEAAGPQVGAGAVRTSKSLAECSPGPLVREIATAYESGFGHGVAGRGPLNPYVSGSFGAEAWEYGHWCGTKRRAPETCERRNQDERTLRRLLAFAYSGSALYGDDGELQDGRHPMIDYVRDSVADIERKIHERGMAKLAAAACPECRYVIGHKAGCSSEKANAEYCEHGYRPTFCPKCPQSDTNAQNGNPQA